MISFQIEVLFNFSSNSEGKNTPNSVINPPVISSAGVTSNAGFQQLIPSAAILIFFTWVISWDDLSSITISDPVFFVKSILLKKILN